MLPEIGATELIVIAAVALIVVGPKDLPVLMRKVGRFMARMRGMAAEFRASFDEMARQSELDELRREVEALRQGGYGQSVTQDIEGSLREIDADLRPDAMRPLPSPAVVEEPPQADAVASVEVEAPEPEPVRQAARS
jgi:sec-independent protein translocase protein TatB